MARTYELLSLADCFNFEDGMIAVNVTTNGPNVSDFVAASIELRTSAEIKPVICGLLRQLSRG